MTLGERLHAVASKDERLVVGLSSGTSFDGIDAALVRIRGHADDVSVELRHFLCVPYEPALRVRISHALTDSVPELARLSFDIGSAFAAAALALLERCDVAPHEVDLVGSHGQTIYHEPPAGGRTGVTLQIGEGDVIAARTGTVTVSDFRTADVAAGGSGAPLVPIVDWLLFRESGRVQVLLNIGGIANITRVTERLEDVAAFDTGPGNALIDEIMAAATGRPGAMDESGQRALRGTVNDRAVAAFLEHPYFTAAPPKSTGRETFGREAAQRLAALAVPGRGLEELSGPELSDVLATAAAVTARSISDGVASLGGAPPERVVVSGGGLRNAAVMRELKKRLAPVPVVALDGPGVGSGRRMDPDAKEAVAFAVLADRTAAGLPGNVPAATGAAAPVVLGKVSAGGGDTA